MIRNLELWLKIDTHKPVDHSHRVTHLDEPLVDGFRFPILVSAKYPPRQSKVSVEPGMPQPTSVTFRADLNGFGGFCASFRTRLDTQIWRIGVPSNNLEAPSARFVLFTDGESNERRLVAGVIIFSSRRNINGSARFV